MAADPKAGAPHGITLFDHAQISAEIAEGNRPQAEVLKGHDLTDAQWNESTSFWMGRLGEDVQQNGQDARVPQVYSEAFGKAQDALKPLPPTDVASYAALVVAIQVAGDPAKPLEVRGLSNADYLRLSRHWAKVLSSDEEQAKAYFEHYQALQPKPAP